jgi:hypothetical protein
MVLIPGPGELAERKHYSPVDESEGKIVKYSSYYVDERSQTKYRGRITKRESSIIVVEG